MVPTSSSMTMRHLMEKERSRNDQGEGNMKINQEARQMMWRRMLINRMLKWSATERRIWWENATPSQRRLVGMRNC